MTSTSVRTRSTGPDREPNASTAPLCGAVDLPWRPGIGDLPSLTGPALTATSFFHGAGGDSLGLTLAGYDLVAAANHWPVCVQTHRLNHPETQHHTANLIDTDMRRFPRTNLLWASPSCRWHARSGGRQKPGADTERARSDFGSVDRATAFAVVEAAEVHGYDAIIVENVREFADWVLYPEWLVMLAKLGYTAQPIVLDAVALGTPQRRPRLYIVFTRHGAVDLTLPNTPPVPASTILDADPGRLVTRRTYVDRQLEEIEDLDRPHLVTYRRNARARPADTHPLATITAGGNHHAVATRTRTGMYLRMLTNRECARGQGFPDTYQWAGNATEVKRMIGNAVPVSAARWLGGRVAQSLMRT